jgi:Mg2+/citrate symporter
MPEVKPPIIGLKYDTLIASLPTLNLVAMKEILFVAGGDFIGLPQEQPMVDCIELIDELVVPNMQGYENIVVDMLSFPTLESTCYIGE